MTNNCEDGINSGARNIGRFFLAMIPWALGIGFMVWLGVYTALHEIDRERAQESRANTYTGGSKVNPKNPIAIEVLNRSCITITKADLNGDSLMLYARNDCHEHVTYTSWNWVELSANGTLIHQGYTNSCPIPSQPGDTAECIQGEEGYDEIPEDERTIKMRVWTER